MPNSYTAIPITIDNTQTSATPAPFQQMITVDMNTYSSLANSTLSNVFFLDNNGNPISSWLESGNSNTSTSTVYWLLLPLGIPANSSITVYMCFDNTSNNDFDGITRGEAPQLSSTYAQYDNGNNIFSFYDNFAGTTLSSKWTIITGTGYSVNNGLTTTNVTIQSSSNVNPQAFILDTYSYISAQASADSVAFMYPMQSPTNHPQYYIGCSALGTYNFTNYNGTASNQITLGSASSTSSTIFSTWITTSESLASINYGTSVINSVDFTASTSSPITLYTSTAAGNSAFYQYIRTRTYPPNGTMPTTTFGTQTTKNMVSPTTSPSSALYYVPITLSNSQSSATGTNFQSLFQINPSFFGSAYLQSTMQNVAFYDTNGNLIDSWQETNNSNTATNSTFWVKLANGISAGTSITIFMYFFSTSSNVLNTTTTGQAPQLTSTYAEYDDGANVFPFYDNFAGTTLSSKWAVSGGTSTYAVSNGITVTGANTGTCSTPGILSITSTQTFSPNMITEYYGNWAGSGSTANCYYGGIGYTNNFSGTGNIAFTGTGDTYFGLWYSTAAASDYVAIPYTQSQNYVWSIITTTTNIAAELNYGSQVSYAQEVASSLPIAFSFQSSSNIKVQVTWLRTRVYPPNGILPVYSYGLIAQTTITASGSGSASAVATFLTSQAIQSTGLGSATASFILSQATSGHGSGSALASFILSQALNGKGLASTTVSLIASGLASTPEGLAKTSFFILAVSPLSGKTNASGDYNTVVSAAASLNNPTYQTSETLDYSATYLPPNTNVSSVSSSLNSSATITFTYTNTSSYTSPTITTTIKDSTGTAIPNVLITWTSSNTSAATVSPQTATTNSSGVATTTVTGTGATITATTKLLGLIQTSSVSV